MVTTPWRPCHQPAHFHKVLPWESEPRQGVAGPSLPLVTVLVTRAGEGRGQGPPRGLETAFSLLSSFFPSERCPAEGLVLEEN